MSTKGYFQFIIEKRDPKTIKHEDLKQHIYRYRLSYTNPNKVYEPQLLVGPWMTTMAATDNTIASVQINLPKPDNVIIKPAITVGVDIHVLAGNGMIIGYGYALQQKYLYLLTNVTKEEIEAAKIRNQYKTW